MNPEAGDLVEAWISSKPMVNGRWVIAIILREKNHGNWVVVLHPGGVNTTWLANIKCVGEKRN